MNQFLVKTKLSAPHYRENAVSRPALIRKLSEGLRLNRQVTLVSAPPGYGKTSLIVEWSKNSDVDFIWFTIDKADNEPIRFFSYIIAALQKADANIGIAALSLLEAPRFPPLDMLTGALVNDIAGLSGRIVLVLDDFQHIVNETIGEALRLIFENQPETLHIAILTRQDPAISFSRLRAGGRITEIREGELRFSHQEVLAFLRQTMGLQLEEEQVGLLEARTEGWAAGLQLAALSLQGRDHRELARFFEQFSGTQRYIIDYLFEEAIGQMPVEIRQFLVQTSILERFGSQVCDELLDSSDSAAMIGRILKANLFISPLDEFGQWYRYHTLFRDILKTELSREQQTVLHRKASHWFEARGYLEEASLHAMAAEDWDALERLLVNSAWTMIQNGEIRTLYDRIRALTSERLEKNKEISMVLAWSLLLIGKGKEASALLNEIDFSELVRCRPEIKANLLVLQIFKSISFKELSALTFSEQAAEYTDSDDPVLRTAASYCMAQINSLKGKLDDSVRLYHKAWSSAIHARQYFIAMISVKNLSITLLLQGKKTEALDICREAMAQLVDGKGRLLPAASILYVPLGMACYSEDNLEKAYEYLQKGISVCRKLSLTHFAVQGEMSMALLQFAMRDADGALKTIHDSCRVLKEIGMDIGIPMFTAIEAELYLRNGNLGFAQKWAEEMGFEKTGMQGIMDERQYFTYARILIAEGRNEKAGILLDRLEAEADAGGRTYRRITAQILKAVNYLKMNRPEPAEESLRNAVSQAAPESYYRLFLDEDACIFKLLRKMRNLAPGFIDTLSGKYRQAGKAGFASVVSTARPAAAAIPASVQVPAAMAGSMESEMGLPAEPLSERELEVLRLVAEGLSNRQIADKLFISLGTTKWHIGNIFSKLGVKNRVQAIEAAKGFLIR